MGVSKFVSFGNKADVTDSEMLEYLLYDKNTKVILVFEKEPYPKYIIISAKKSTLLIKGNKLFLVGILILLQFDILKTKM